MFTVHAKLKDQWSCYLCGKWYSKISNLTKHTKLRHSSTNAKTFIENASHRYKQKIQKGFPTCKPCNKSFADERCKKLHMISYHSNGKSPSEVNVATTRSKSSKDAKNKNISINETVLRKRSTKKHEKQKDRNSVDGNQDGSIVSDSDVGDFYGFDPDDVNTCTRWNNGEKNNWLASSESSRRTEDTTFNAESDQMDEQSVASTNEKFYASRMWDAFLTENIPNLEKTSYPSCAYESTRSSTGKTITAPATNSTSHENILLKNSNEKMTDISPSESNVMVAAAPSISNSLEAGARDHSKRICNNNKDFIVPDATALKSDDESPQMTINERRKRQKYSHDSKRLVDENSHVQVHTAELFDVSSVIAMNDSAGQTSMQLSLSSSEVEAEKKIFPIASPQYSPVSEPLAVETDGSYASPLMLDNQQVKSIKLISDNYEEISKNIYASSINPIQSYDLSHCDCKDECGENCLDRQLLMECNPETCKCGNECMNMQMQKNSTAQLITKNKGWGLKTNQSIKSNTFIIEYVGEIVKESLFKERMVTCYKDYNHHYCAQLIGDLVIDNYTKGNISRFVNHSCDPNCKMERWYVNGEPRLALIAIKDIQKGEELCFDYNFSLFDSYKGQVCQCLSENCRNFIVGKRVHPKKVKRSANSVAPYLEEVKTDFAEALQLRSTLSAKTVLSVKKSRLKPKNNAKKRHQRTNYILDCH